MQTRAPITTIFLGNETAYLTTLEDITEITCVVASAVSSETERFFGSSFNYATDRDIPVISPESFLADPAPRADLIVSAGFGRLIPPQTLTSPRIGAINIHPSLLPAYRGRHPLNWAIINGESQTGVTIHHMDESFDGGDIIAQRGVEIDSADTIMDVFAKAVGAGNALLREVIGLVGTPPFAGTPQDEAKASFYPPRKPEDGMIHWNDSAERIHNLVRALTTPYPGAFFVHQSQRIAVDEVEVMADSTPLTPIGEPVADGRHVHVRTGQGTIRLTKLRGIEGERFRKHIGGES